MNQQIRKSNFPKDKSIRLTLHLYLSNRKLCTICLLLLLADGIWILSKILMRNEFQCKTITKRNVIKQTLIRKTQWTIGFKTGIRIRFIFFSVYISIHTVLLKSLTIKARPKTWWDRYDDQWVVCWYTIIVIRNFARVKYSPVCVGRDILMILILIWSCVMCGSFTVYRMTRINFYDTMWEFGQLSNEWTSFECVFVVLTMRIHIVKSKRNYPMFLCMK